MTKYEQIPTDETDSTTLASSTHSQEDLSRPFRQSAGRRRNHVRRRVSDIAITIFTTVLVVIGSQYLYRSIMLDSEKLFRSGISAHYSEAARLNPKYHCGETSADAKELGCVFDLSLVGWVPRQCFDADLNQRFMDWGWKFFQDQNGTIEVPLDYIAESAGTREPFWAQHGYHITHCELAWERMHRALQGGKRLTTHMLNLEHTKHCGMMNELRDDFYSLNSQILPLLNSC